MVVPFDPFAKAPPKPFTDRDPFKALFWETLAHLRPDHPTVLIFTGVGGIGKSALVEELRRIATAPRGSSEQRAQKDGNAATCWAGLDFATPEHRSPDTALRYLAQHLHATYGWAFPTFSLAYAEYWSRKNPDIALQKKNLPFVDDGDLLFDILGQIDDLSDNMDAAGLGLLTKVPKLVHRLSTASREAWTRRVTPELQRLAALEKADDVLALLFSFFAKDVRAALETDGRRLVIALDAYDDLTGGRWDAFGAKEQDLWVRNGIRQLPGTLWLVAVRDPLPWRDYDDEGWTDDDLRQHPVDVLAPEDADTFLRASGVAEADIRAHVVEALHGHPLHLNVSVDTYRLLLAQGQTPKPDEFAAAPNEVVTCFLKYLDERERDALFVLSAARWWDEDVFDLLMRRFNTGYSTEAMRRDLIRFSFVEALPGDAERWKMHDAMRTALAERGQQVKQAHEVLFEHYAAQVGEIDLKAITPQQRTAFSEAAYHARHGLPPDPACRWFFSKSLELERAAEWRFLERECEIWTTWCERVLGAEHPDTLTSVNNLAALYRATGRYAEAEPLYERVLLVRERVLGAEHPNTLTSVNNLAGLYYSTGRYAEAEPLLERALAGLRKTLPPGHPHLQIVAGNLAALRAKMRDEA